MTSIGTLAIGCSVSGADAHLKYKKHARAHPDLNWGPSDLQSDALPLSYTPVVVGERLGLFIRGEVGISLSA